MTKSETLLADLRAAAHAFATRPNQDDFAVRSAEASYDLSRRLAVHGNLTVAQWNYAEKLVGWARPRAAAAPAAPAALSSNVSGVFELFRRAKSAGLRFPKIRLEASDGQKVVLSQAGERSRYLGEVMMTDGAPFGSNTFFGRIDSAGNLNASRSMTAPVRELVDALAADPAKVASIYGRRTGSCCFCARGLEDGRSVAVGYGPVCAEKFGLPWGEEKAEAVEVRLGAKPRAVKSGAFGITSTPWTSDFPEEAGNLDDVAALAA